MKINPSDHNPPLPTFFILFFFFFFLFFFFFFFFFNFFFFCFFCPWLGPVMWFGRVGSTSTLARLQSGRFSFNRGAHSVLGNAVTTLWMTCCINQCLKIMILKLFKLKMKKKRFWLFAMGGLSLRIACCRIA